ncbi:MAG TPA: 5'/3'-nucleotidase SurE [Tepidiformaceae bacterium]|nr:5'/3'-nucleotidase SurE [Tepidiformaceae bacterium]
MKRSILVTNDDGIESAGLWALARAASRWGDRIIVVAPRHNQSAVGAGFTLRRELNWERVAEPGVPGVEAWHVDGTPADCITVAFDKLLDEEVSLVVSGINRGANVGNDVLASGTVGGAMAGNWRGVASVAFSLAMDDINAEPDWPTAEEVASLICKAEAEGELPATVLLNVNVPHCRFEEITGILVTRMGRHGYVRLLERGSNTAVLERQYDVHTDPLTPPGTDIWALANNYVSVTPLQSNLTDHRLIDMISETLNAAFRQ